MINTVDELTQRLRQEASDLEECGSVDLACGIAAAVRIIEDELNPLDAIGGEGAGGAPAGDVVDREELDIALAKIDQLEGRSIAQAERLNAMVRMGAANEAAKQAIIEAVRGVKLTHPRFKELQADVVEAESLVRALPGCKACHRSGITKGLYFVYECLECHGTGCDVSNPEALMAGQQEIIRKQQVLMNAVLHELYQCGLSEEERMAISVESFYANSKNNIRLD